jgi:hypothetical protein
MLVGEDYDDGALFFRCRNRKCGDEETLFRMVEGDESRKKVPPSTLHRNHHDEIILIMMVAAAH